MKTTFKAATLSVMSAITLATGLGLYSSFASTNNQALAKQTLLTPIERSQQSVDALATDLYTVKVDHGERIGPSGKSREYALYIPQAHGNLSAGPFPLVVLLHGFLMTGAQQSTNAQNLAERGFVVFAPNLTRLLLGDGTRMENVHDVIDHIQWLTGKDSPVKGGIDKNRVAVGGNSSGGAVIIEVALEAQKLDVPIAGLLDLDGTIWERSFDRVPAMKPLKILSLRCEPSLCNEHARQLDHFRQLSFPIDDVKVIGAHHCDVENPTTLRCRCACGASHEGKFRKVFAQLIYSWLRDNFGNPNSTDSTPPFKTLVHDMAAEKKVVAQLDRPVKTWLASKSELVPGQLLNVGSSQPAGSSAGAVDPIAVSNPAPSSAVRIDSKAETNSRTSSPANLNSDSQPNSQAYVQNNVQGFSRSNAELNFQANAQ